MTMTTGTGTYHKLGVKHLTHTIRGGIITYMAVYSLHLPRTRGLSLG